MERRGGLKKTGKIRWGEGGKRVFKKKKGRATWGIIEHGSPPEEKRKMKPTSLKLKGGGEEIQEIDKKEKREQLLHLRESFLFREEELFQNGKSLE